MVRPPPYGLYFLERGAGWWGPDFVSQSGRKLVGKGAAVMGAPARSPLPTVGSLQLPQLGRLLLCPPPTAPGAYSEAALESPPWPLLQLCPTLSPPTWRAVTFEAPTSRGDLMEVRAQAG